MNKDTLIHEIRNRLENFDEVEFAFIYGSYAVNKETPMSDVDIAIYQKNDKSRYDLRITELKVESELTRLLPVYKFDVRSMNDAPIIIVGKILNEGKLLFYKTKISISIIL